MGLSSSSYQLAWNTETIQEMGEISEPTFSTSRRFRQNVNLSFGKIKQPEEIQIRVVTNANLEVFSFDDIFSMTIKLPVSNGITQDDTHMRALGFLGGLLGKKFESLETLSLFGFCVPPSLWESLCKLNRVELRLTCPLLDPSEFKPDVISELSSLELNLEENCDLSHFPYLPSSLVNLSLRFSNLKSSDKIVDISHCNNLRIM
jgi:hypothetical protein